MDVNGFTQLMDVNGFTSLGVVTVVKASTIVGKSNRLLPRKQNRIALINRIFATTLF
jgi:hypothetical protein